MSDVPDDDARGTAPALRFLAAVRHDPDLRHQVAALDPGAGLQAVIEIAHAAGFRVTAEDLRAAHAQDWGLRRALLRYGDAVASAPRTAAVVNVPSSTT
jgi:predicted ribosomally synthesized peptide with nif11-like leader